MRPFPPPPSAPAHLRAHPNRYWKLYRWANRQRGLYGVPIYLCGSALRDDNPEPRDWDIRITLPDREFERRFGPVTEWNDQGCTGNWGPTRWRWSDECVRASKDASRWTGLNCDVQIYAASHVRAVYHGKPRLQLDTRRRRAAA